MQDVARRRDRIAAEKERPAGALRRRDQTERGRGVAGDVAVATGGDGRRLHLVRGAKHLGGLAEVVAGSDDAAVRLGDVRCLAKAFLDPFQRRLDRSLEQPRGQPEGEEVARPHHGAGGQAHFVQSVDGQLGDADLEDLVAVERAVGERVGCEFGLAEVLLGELLLVDDQDAVRRKVGDVDLEGGGIHRHQHVWLVARREDVVTREVQLEAAHAGQGSGGRADLGGEVGQGAEIVSRQGALVGEVHPGQLHAVAGVAGETNDHLVPFFDDFHAAGGRRSGTT